MRIAFISAMAGVPWGGSELLWSQAAQHLLEMGHQVFVGVKRWPDAPDSIRDLASGGAMINRRYEDFPSADDPTVARLGQYIRRKRAARSARQRLRSFRPDLVCICHGSAYCGLEWMLYCHGAGIPYANVAQANAEQFWPDDATADLLLTLYAAARDNYFVSGRNLELLEAQIGSRLTNAHVIRNPYQVPFDSKPTWPLESDGWKVACVGRLDAQAKGQDLVLQILAKNEWRGRNLSVSFFGNGPNARSLQRYAKTLGVEQRARFCGHSPDVSAIWETHHALLLPSRFEGLPLAVVEAMLCARIPIVTDVAGNTEVVSDGVTGFVAHAPTLLLLAETLERAWEHRHTWRAMGALAGETIRKVLPQRPAEAFAMELLRSASQC